MKIEVIKFWRGYDRNSGRYGWFCQIDPKEFVAGVTGKSFGCCRCIALIRAKRDLRRKVIR